MQPLDTASPKFSDPSPAEGTITDDVGPTISVKLSDVGTCGYTFGVESILMKVNGRKVPHKYSGGVVTYTPLRLPGGDTNVIVKASDYAKNSAQISWTFIIRPPPTLPANVPPIIGTGGPYSVEEGGTVELDGTGSRDPDGDPLIFSWTIIDDPTGAASLTDEDTATPIFHAPEDVDEATDVSVKVTVNDDHGHSRSDTTTVRILPRAVPVGPILPFWAVTFIGVALVVILLVAIWRHFSAS